MTRCAGSMLCTYTDRSCTQVCMRNPVSLIIELVGRHFARVRLLELMPANTLSHQMVPVILQMFVLSCSQRQAVTLHSHSTVCFSHCATGLQ